MEIVFEVKVDGRVINIASRDVMGPNDDAVYDIELTVGQTVEITKNGVPLKVNGTDETVFTATIEGAHVFWVNKAGQVWVDEPELPPVEHDFAFVIGGQVSEIDPSEMTEGEAKDNMAVYKGVALEKDQVIGIKDGETDLHFWAYNETDGNHDTGATYIVPWDGEYTFWVNKDGKVWVTAPTAPVVQAVYTVEKGGVALTIESREELDGNHAVYDIELAVGDTIVIKKDGVALKLGDTDATEFTATIAGAHVFYVNVEDKVYVTEPELPPVVHSFAFIVDGEDSEITQAEMSEEEARGNMAVYKGVALEKDQVIGIKDGDEDLHFWASNGEGGSQDIGAAYTVPWDGEYTFWVNKDGKVWVDVPTAPVVQAVYTVEKNGALLEVESDLDIGTDHAVYDIDLAIGDTIVIKKDGVALKLGDTDETEFTARLAGEHTFYVNHEDKVFVNEPAEPTIYTVEKGGVELDIESEEELDGNNAVYKIDLAVGDTIVIKADGEALEIADSDATEFTATIAGMHIFYVNSADEVYVTEPELPPVVHNFAFTIGGQASEVVASEMSEEEARGNLAVYKGVALQKDQVIGIKDGEEDLHFWASNGEGGSQDIGAAYTVPWDGEYTFWVNKDGKVWIDVPEEPVVEPVYTVEKGGRLLEIESREELDGNHAVYDIELAVGDTIVIKKDGVALKIGNTDATEFTATIAGKHTFWVNSSDQVWVDQPTAPTGVISVIVNDAVVTVEPEANPGADNKAVYKVTLAVGDVISFKEDGEFIDFCHWDSEQNKAVSDGQAFTATIAGVHTFYNNKKNEIYISQPVAPTGVISILVNDEAVTVEPEANPGDNNKAVYKVTLAVGDTISFKEDGEFVDFYHWDGEQNKAVSDGHTFTATIAGEHTFYINKDNQIYIGQPTAPVDPIVEVGYTVEKDGAALTIESEEELEGNNAVYKIDLAIGEKIVIKKDGVALKLGDSDATEFTAEIAGIHTFYVNSSDKVYVVEPKPVAKAVFHLGANDESKKGQLTSAEAKSFTETVGDYTLELSSMSRVFKDCYDASGDCCLKLGSNKGVGSFVLTAPNDVSKVVFSVAGYRTSHADISINNGEGLTISTLSEQSDYTIVEATPDEDQKISFATLSTGKIAMINYISFF